MKRILSPLFRVVIAASILIAFQWMPARQEAGQAKADTLTGGQSAEKGKEIKKKPAVRPVKSALKTPKSDTTDKNVKQDADAENDASVQADIRTDPAADKTVHRTDEKQENQMKKGDVEKELPVPDDGKGAAEDTGETEEKDTVKTETEPLVFIVNPGDNMEGIAWSGIYGSKDIAFWAKHRGMTLQNDAGPIIDGMAGFIHKYGTSFTVKNLHREKKYSFYMDYVRFGHYNGEKYPSELKIFVKARDLGEECIGALLYSKAVKQKALYRVSIPYKFTVKGEVDITLREFSPMQGFWGVWDMVVTDAVEFNEALIKKTEPLEPETDTMQEKDHILEIK